MDLSPKKREEGARRRAAAASSLSETPWQVDRCAFDGRHSGVWSCCTAAGVGKQLMVVLLVLDHRGRRGIISGFKAFKARPVVVRGYRPRRRGRMEANAIGHCDGLGSPAPLVYGSLFPPLPCAGFILRVVCTA